jgi:hypothetical protein
MVRTALGIFREIQNSPNRESDDALILKAVMEELRQLNVRVELLTPEEADERELTGFDMIVPMCESYPRLMRLRELEKTTSTLVVNRPDSVLNCYRTRMIPCFEKAGDVPFPPTEFRSVGGADRLKAPEFDLSEGMWVKRGDVHNTCLHDVVFAKDMKGAEEIRKDFAQREIVHMLFQRHIDGDLIKFYGVGPGSWFTWFYHDPSTARRLPFDLEALSLRAQAAARAVDLKIFGGDAIIGTDGKIYVIDINSWPSFAKVRAEAARQIARQLAVLEVRR